MLVRLSVGRSVGPILPLYRLEGLAYRLWLTARLISNKYLLYIFRLNCIIFSITMLRRAWKSAPCIYTVVVQGSVRVYILGKVLPAYMQYMQPAGSCNSFILVTFSWFYLPRYFVRACERP